MDPQLAAMASSPYGDPTPPQADVDDFLRKKRKAREHKACYPCRQRKVKCDLTRPCQTCRDRDHPELCSYHPPNKRPSVENSAPVRPPVEESTPGSGIVTLGRNEFDLLCRKLNGLENSIAGLKRELARNSQNSRDSLNDTIYHESEPSASITDGQRQHRPSHTDVHGIHTKNESGEIVHLGGGSIPAMLYAFSQGESPTAAHQSKLQEFLGKSVLPLFGLDNESATYPFVDLWGLPHGSLQRAQELAKALPGDSQLLNLFRDYRDMGHVIFPGIADVEQLESEITLFLIDRVARSSVEDGVTEQSIYGKSCHWVGMLFAALALGAQCSSMARKERELTSQVYVCCAFECLRFTNFLSQPHIESIQTLLIIGNVMTNNMNAGTAWSMLGLTIRLAQGLGLHQACPPHTPKDLVFRRSKVWWAVIWQDSLLSIIYDRNAALDVHTMPMPQRVGSVSPYHASMYRLCKVGLQIVRDRSKPANSHERMNAINHHRDEIAIIMRDSAEYLRDSRKCSTTRENIEHWGLYLHTSYALTELCRPAVSLRGSDEMVKAFKSVCIENLANTVEAFLGLNSIIAFTRQSWAAMHRALSSALLLGILGEHLRNDRAHKLVSRFIAVMTDITANVDPQEISAPVQRGITALQKLSIDRPRTLSFVEGVTMGPAGNGLFTGDGDLIHRYDQNQSYTPSNSESTAVAEDEFSPYSVLNTILWGSNDKAQDPETFSMGTS